MATGRTGPVGWGLSEETSAPERLKAGACLAGYTLSARLARSPLTELWLAGRDGSNRDLPARVALRIARRGCEAEASPLLKREYAVLSALDPAARAPRALDFLPDVPALVMEHIEGVTLEEVLALAEEGLLVIGLETALDLGLELANALRAAHSTFLQRKRIFHGRLSPTQILIDERGELSLLGFGRALAEAPPAPFRPPERLTERPLDNNTDQWSLGAILSELACATLRDASAAPAAARVMGVPPPLARKLAWVERSHPALGETLRRAMAFDPADRFRPESELGRALLGLVNEQPRGSRRDGLFDQVRPHSAFLRRALALRRKLSEAEHPSDAPGVDEEKVEGIWVHGAQTPPFPVMTVNPPLELSRRPIASDVDPIFLPNGATDIDESGDVSVFEESESEAFAATRNAPWVTPSARRATEQGARGAMASRREDPVLGRHARDRARSLRPVRNAPTVTDLPPLPPRLPRPIPRESPAERSGPAMLSFWLRVLGLMILLGVLVGVLL